MSLSSGQRLGPYEVVAPIGAGGMGEVFRARDTQLDRDVALKVLPDAVAHDRERLARFEREARTLASLNHPNIAAIYGVEKTPDSTALVMELVEGEDLSTLIATGHVTPETESVSSRSRESHARPARGGGAPRGLSIDDAVPIARQIADALEAAHERGVIHRDLKPANIKVRDDGTVKLLDFGLAKALSPDADREASGSIANSPTMTSPAMTQQGFILGTAAFMSPEQAKGRAVDRRADIWAFGVVLYEMLTGRHLFEGESVSETLAAVLRQEIDLAELPAGTPPELKRLVARCLDRDPRTRLRDIGEARVLLSSPLADPAASGPVALAGAAPPRGRTPFAWAAGGLLLGAGLVGVALWMTGGAVAGGGDADRPPTIALRRLTNLPGPERHPDISPDGRQVLYTSSAAGNRDIYLLRVGGARAINLTAGSADDDEQAQFSPTGDQIVFRSNRDAGGLFLMGATGESVKRLTTAGYDPAWSPDGRRIVYSTEGVFDPYSRSIFAELWTVDVATGQASRLFAGDAVQPAWSPDGSRIAYWANTGGQRDIWTIPAAGGTPEAVTKDAATDWSPAWSPDGRWLYFASDRGGSMNLWRVGIDQATGRTTGNPQAVTNSVRALGSVHLSADGTRMIAMGYDSTSELTVFGFDPSAPDRLVPRATIRNQAFEMCDPSPDGAWLACTNRGAHEDLGARPLRWQRYAPAHGRCVQGSRRHLVARRQDAGLLFHARGQVGDLGDSGRRVGPPTTHQHGQGHGHHGVVAGWQERDRVRDLDADGMADRSVAAERSAIRRTAEGCGRRRPARCAVVVGVRRARGGEFLS